MTHTTAANALPPLAICASLHEGDQFLHDGRWRTVTSVEDRDLYLIIHTDSGQFVAAHNAPRRVRRAS